MKKLYTFLTAVLMMCLTAAPAFADIADPGVLETAESSFPIALLLIIAAVIIVAVVIIRRKLK